jgi:hypothetical protein
MQPSAKGSQLYLTCSGNILLQDNTSTNWLRPSFADELFALGQPLDAAEYFMIMSDAERE